MVNADFTKPFILDKDAIYCSGSSSGDNFISKIVAESDEILWQRNFGENSIEDLDVFGFTCLVAVDSKVQEIDLRVYILVTPRALTCSLAM